MMTLDLLWWLGWIWFVGCAAAPLLLIQLLGLVPGVVAAALLAPWSALAGMAAVHRALPNSETGKFRLFQDRGGIHWALKGWAPSVYFTVFQPVFFLNPGFQRVALRAFGGRIGPGSTITSRTILREPHRVRIGRESVIGEGVHLAGSFQPRPGLLIVADIDIGDGVLIGAYSHFAPGVSIGSGCILEHGIRVGPHSIIGGDTRIGEGTTIYGGVRIGSRVVIGKQCRIPSRSVIGDGAKLPDGMVWREPAP